MGARYIFNITGGTIQGPKINGTLVAPSGDWGMPMPDGGYRLDVRAWIKTNDGEFIFVEYNGVVVASKEVNDRYLKSDVVTAKEQYFFSAPTFTTESNNYDWLNKVQVVGKMVDVSTKGVKYDLFIVR